MTGHLFTEKEAKVSGRSPHNSSQPLLTLFLSVGIWLLPEDDDVMEEMGSITLRDDKKMPFSPRQLMTYDQGFSSLFLYFLFSFLTLACSDSHIIATGLKSKRSLVAMDLERPDIVEEWSTGPYEVEQIYDKSKGNDDERVIPVLNEQGSFPPGGKGRRRERREHSHPPRSTRPWPLALTIFL